MTCHEVVLHGHSVVFRTAGEGPVLMLVHGMAGSGASCSSGTA